MTIEEEKKDKVDELQDSRSVPLPSQMYTKPVDIGMVPI